MKDWERLGQILLDGRILAFPPFGASTPVVCFTECTRAGIQTLMAEGRYTPSGLAFAKDFAEDAGPALYVRGDEWDQVNRMPAELRARAVRFWPGATSTKGLPLPWYVTQKSEWLHEREWRAPGAGAPPHFAFEWGDVAFVIAPNGRSRRLRRRLRRFCPRPVRSRIPSDPDHRGGSRRKRHSRPSSRLAVALQPNGRLGWPGGLSRPPPGPMRLCHRLVTLDVVTVR